MEHRVGVRRGNGRLVCDRSLEKGATLPDLHIHTLVVRDHRISCCDATMVQHGMGHDAISLDLDAEWDGLTITVVVGECDAAYDAVWQGEPWVLPAVSLFEAGWLPVTVVGRDDSGAVRVVTERCDHLLRVVASGCVDGSVPPEDAPDILHELLGAAEDAREAAEGADAAAESAQQWAERAQSVVNVKRATQVTVGEGMPKVGGIAGDSYIDYESGNLWEFEEV